VLKRKHAAELGVASAAVAYSMVARHLPRHGRIAANLGFAGGALLVARAAGASTAELGLARTQTARGIRAGLLASVPVAAAAAAAVSWPALRTRLAEPRITETTPAEASFEVFVRIPIETAVAEEVIFRGALLGLGLRERSCAGAVLASSLAFGLWHVPTTVAGLHSQTANERWVATAAVVAATTIGGVALAILRLRANSVIAPMIAHAALNMTTYTGVRVMVGKP
jgi:uncharacterized protein